MSKQDLYLMRNDFGLWKIGISKDANNRVSQVSNSSGVPVRLVKVWVTDIEASIVERHLHKFFNDFRKVGEWFLFEDFPDAFVVKTVEDELLRFTDVNNHRFNRQGETEQETPTHIDKMTKEELMIEIEECKRRLESLEYFSHKNSRKAGIPIEIMDQSKLKMKFEIDKFTQDRKVFHWDCLKEFLNENYYDKEVKDCLLEKGYRSKRVNFKYSKKTYWYRSEIPLREVKEVIKNYTPLTL